MNGTKQNGLQTENNIVDAKLTEPKIQETTATSNILLANIVSIFHTLVVLFVLITPFFDIPYFLILHFTFCVSLLVHWWGNSNVCSLSVIESKLRGLNYTESFTHKFVSPIYDISKTTWARICYIITIVLMGISAYKIYNSSKWQEAIQCYRNGPQINNLPVTERLLITLKLYFQCTKILFCL